MMDMAEVARMEERRIAAGVREIAEHAMEWEGGVAARGSPGAWINCAFGAGVDTPLTADSLEQLRAFYEPHGIEARVEISSLADHVTWARLAAAGFEFVGFENVLASRLTRETKVAPIHGPPEGVGVERVDPADEAMVRTYASVSVSGFFPPGQVPTEQDLALAAQCIRHSRTWGFVAREKGEVVGAGAVEVAGPIAALFGTTVLPHSRRKGVQQMLLAARMNFAAERGAVLATIGSRPGLGTERNVRRMGFELVYVKGTFAKPGPGLARVIG